MVASQKRKLKRTHPGPSPQGSGPSFLTVARVRRPFGVKGELLLEILTDFPNRLSRYERLYAGDDRQPYEVASLRRHGEGMLLQLKAVRDRNAAERLRGALLSIRADDLPPLPAGTYYLHQVEGLDVFTENGERLGRVMEILKTGANDVYVVRGEKGEVLLPAIASVIRSVEPAEGRMVVRLMDGLV
jgi:16S rRNA processing protein RimM